MISRLRLQGQSVKINESASTIHYNYGVLRGLVGRVGLSYVSKKCQLVLKEIEGSSLVGYWSWYMCV